MKKLAFIPVLAVLLLASACQINGNTHTTPIPTTSVSPVTGEEAADDIILTPGGPAYRARFYQEGVVNPWPPIESSEAILEDNGNYISLHYRDYIETKVGETRNNILYLQSPGSDISSLKLYAIDIPTGIEVKERMRWHGPIGTVLSIIPVLIIEVSQDVKPGQYTFEISLEIDGKDYGCVPCIIKIIE